MKLNISKCENVAKKWGKEIVIVNNDSYCGKILCIEAGKKFSMHFHMDKDETWYVARGVLMLSYIDTSNAQRHHMDLKIGDVVRVHPGIPHQLQAVEYSEIYEVSTPHRDDDSYRVEKGDSQL
jgi:mannose-6-phosphate isomerase-like protein (cupin superfamily)